MTRRQLGAYIEVNGLAKGSCEAMRAKLTEYSRTIGTTLKVPADAARKPRKSLTPLPAGLHEIKDVKKLKQLFKQFGWKTPKLPDTDPGLAAAKLQQRLRRNHGRERQRVRQWKPSDQLATRIVHAASKLPQDPAATVAAAASARDDLVTPASPTVLGSGLSDADVDDDMAAEVTTNDTDTECVDEPAAPSGGMEDDDVPMTTTTPAGQEKSTSTRRQKGGLTKTNTTRVLHTIKLPLTASLLHPRLQSHIGEVKERLGSMGTAKTKIIGAASANLSNAVVHLVKSGSIKELRKTLEKSAEHVKEVAKKAKDAEQRKEWGAKKKKEREDSRAHKSAQTTAAPKKRKKKATSSTAPGPATSATVSTTPIAGGAGHAAPPAAAPPQPPITSQTNNKECEKFVNTLFSFVVRKCAGQGTNVQMPAGLPEEFTVHQALLYQDEVVKGKSQLVNQMIQQLQKDTFTFTTRGFIAEVKKAVCALGTSGKQRGTIATALKYKTVSLDGLPRAAAQCIRKVRKLCDSPNKFARLFRAWELGVTMMDIRRDHNAKLDHHQKRLYHVPPVKLVPEASSKRHFVEYSNTSIGEPFKGGQLASVKDSLGTLFNWGSPAFKGLEDSWDPPTTITTDGIGVHFRFEEPVTKQRYVDGKPVDKVMTRYGHHYLIEKRRDPVMDSVAELNQSGKMVGLVNADKFLKDVRRVLTTGAADGATAQELATATALAEMLNDTKLWAANDPGYKFQTTRDDGEAVPIGLCYSNKKRKPTADETQQLQVEKQRLSLHNNNVDTWNAIIPQFIAVHSRLVDVYGSNNACVTRTGNKANRDGMLERIVDSIARKADGTPYLAIAWGANYIGGRTLAGVRVAGPTMVKAILRELSRRVLVLLGKCSNATLLVVV